MFTWRLNENVSLLKAGKIDETQALQLLHKVIQTPSLMVPLPLDGLQHSASLKEGVPIYLTNVALVQADAQRGLLNSNLLLLAHR